jgi:hypothetical protein
MTGIDACNHPAGSPAIVSVVDQSVDIGDTLVSLRFEHRNKLGELGIQLEPLVR